MAGREVGGREGGGGEAARWTEGQGGRGGRGCGSLEALHELVHHLQERVLDGLEVKVLHGHGAAGHGYPLVLPGQ